MYNSEDLTVCTTTEAGAIAALTARPITDNIDGHPFVLDPSGKLTSVEHLLAQPMRPRGTSHVTTVDCLLELLSRYQHNDTIVWIDRNLATGRLAAVAVLNEHPGWRDWRIKLDAQTTPDWEAWINNNKRQLSQTELASFLDQRLENIVQPAGSACPSGAEVLTFVSRLEETRKVKYGSAINLQNGMVQIEFVEEGDDATRGKLEVFREFAVGLAPYQGGQPYEIRAALRYRIERNSGAIQFHYELRNIDRVIESACNDMISQIQRAGHTTVFGKPD